MSPKSLSHFNFENIRAENLSERGTFSGREYATGKNGKIF